MAFQKTTFCVFLFLQVLTGAWHGQAEGANPDCPDGWTQYSSYCYSVSSTSLSWQDAQTYCNGLGAELVKITSEEENDFVLALARRDATTRGRIWIGLLWSSMSQDFFWSDLSEPVYKNWAKNRPLNRDDLPCTVMWTDLDTNYPSGRWNDRQCNIVEGYLCGIVCKRLPQRKLACDQSRSIQK